MARKLAHRLGSGTDEQPDGGTRNRHLVDRREFVRLGSVAAALALGAGASVTGVVADEVGTTFATNFEEYAE